jgi:hypothetical protein
MVILRLCDRDITILGLYIYDSNMALFIIHITKLRFEDMMIQYQDIFRLNNIKK